MRKGIWLEIEFVENKNLQICKFADDENITILLAMNIKIQQKYLEKNVPKNYVSVALHSLQHFKHSGMK